MKTSAIFVAAALAVSVSAQNFGQNNRNNNVGGFRGNFGNNQNNGFFGQNNNGKNGQNNNQNKNQGQNRGGQAQNNGAQNNNNNNKGNNNANNNKGNNNANNNKGQTTTAAAATATAAATTSAAAVAQTSAAAAASDNSDPQKSTTLDPKVIATGFADDGQDVPTAGQVASLTSTNNFINFCLTVPNLPITNGKQITTGSCNPAPMGVIPSTDNMPSAKFTVPKNGDSFAENTPFTITMAVANFQTGAFVNAAENYFAAPQQLNAQGQIIGHSHVVVEQLSALDQTTPTDPKKFAFFKGLNAAAVNGLLTASVDAGLPAGFYKVSSINTAANHQPVLVPIAQHGSLDDVVYFTVTAAGANATAATGASGAQGGAAASSAAPAAASSAAAKPIIAPAPVRGTQAVNQQKNNGNIAAPAPVRGTQAVNNKNQGNNKGQQNNGRNRRHARAFAQL